MPFLPLVVAVIMGGWSGACLGATKLPGQKTEKILEVIVVVAVAFLMRKVFLLSMA